MLHKNNLKRIAKTCFLSVMLLLTVSFPTSVFQTMAAEQSGTAVENPLQVGVDDSTDPLFAASYEKVAQNKDLVLFADKEKGLFAFEDINNGKIWYSTPRDSMLDKKTKGKQKVNLQSQIIIDYIYKDDENTDRTVQTANSQSACINRGGIKVTLLNNGIRVLYNFVELGIKIPVEYTLGTDYLQATADVAHIDEGKQCYLIGINLLPTMGAGNWEETGYLFVPDGCGAIINFNNNVNMLHPYESMVYGTDLSIDSPTRSNLKETIRLPVFGTVSNGSALMGVITQGDGAASILAVTGNDITGYNAVSSKAVLKILSTKKSFYTTNHRNDIMQISHNPYGLDSYQVRYYPLTGSKASYVGMAERYRQYLTEEKGFSKNPVSPSLAIDLYGAVDTKANFLGITYDKLMPLTTYNQAVNILKDIKSRGVSSIAVRFIGWSNNGILNKKIPNNATPLQILGGQKDFNSLKSYSANNQVTFYPDVDFIQYRSSGNGISSLWNCAKTLDGNPALQHEYMLSVYETKLGESPIRLLSPKKFSYVSGQYIKSYTKSDVGSVGLSGVGNMFYSDFHKTDGLYRSQLVNCYLDILNKFKQNKINMVVDGGNSYVLPYVQRVFDTPIYSSGYDIFNEDVPFYQIVLHGYCNLTVPEMVQSIEPEVTYLKAVETGSELLYAGIYQPANILSDTRYDNLYSSTYSLWADDAISGYAKYSELLNKVNSKPIIAHEKIENNAYMTAFEGGINVIVNYNKSPIIYKGHEIQGMSFLEMGDD
jgi:hypothetical protein